MLFSKDMQYDVSVTSLVDKEPRQKRSMGKSPLRNPFSIKNNTKSDIKAKVFFH